jgi:hypothetical protein
MVRTLTSIAFLAAICAQLAAQNSPPAVIFRGHCEDGFPSYRQWFQQTRLSAGEPFVAPDKKKQQILQDYSRLKVAMSREEVEKVLGNPDFSSPRPAARLATAPEPTEQVCSSEFAYVITKKTENMADLDDVAVYLLFTEAGKLYWAIPQNLPGLKPLGAPPK